MRRGRCLGRGLAAIGFLALLAIVATRLPLVAVDRKELYAWGVYAPLVGFLLVAIPFSTEARAGSYAAILVAALAGAGVATYTLGFWGQAQERELLRVERDPSTAWVATTRWRAGRLLVGACLSRQRARWRRPWQDAGAGPTHNLEPYPKYRSPE